MAKKGDSQNAQTMAAEEMPPQKSYRDRIKERYPDNIPENDDGWPELENRYATEMEDQLGSYKEAEQVMQEVVTAYPEMAGMLYDIAVNHVPPRVALAKYFSQEDLIPQEGDDDFEAYKSAYEERKANAGKRSAWEKEMQANQEETIKNIDKYCAAKGYDEAKKTELLDFMESAFSDLLLKKVSPAILEAFDKAMNYDADMAAAKSNGVIEGKNAAIEVKRKDVPVDDGVPQPVNTGSMEPAPLKQKNSLFDGMRERKGI